MAKYSDFNRELCTWILLFGRGTVWLNTLILTGNYVPEYSHFIMNMQLKPLTEIEKKAA